MLKEIDEEINNCNKCGEMVEKFCNSQTISFGISNDILIIGEAPANNGWRKSGVAWYDIYGKILPSGKVLQSLLDIIDVKLGETTFLEAMKCYPKDRKYISICSGNCHEYLVSQIELLNPKYIFVLGSEATKSVLNIQFNNFNEIVGRRFILWDSVVIPIYHPSPVSPLSFKGNLPIFESLANEFQNVKKI